MKTEQARKTSNVNEAPAAESKAEAPKATAVVDAARAAALAKTPQVRSNSVTEGWGSAPHPNNAYEAGGRHSAKRVQAAAAEQAKKHAPEGGAVMVVPTGQGSGAKGPNAHHAIVVVGPKGVWGRGHGGGAAPSVVRWALIHASAYGLPVVAVGEAAKAALSSASA